MLHCVQNRLVIRLTEMQVNQTSTQLFLLIYFNVFPYFRYKYLFQTEKFLPPDFLRVRSKVPTGAFRKEETRANVFRKEETRAGHFRKEENRKDEFSNDDSPEAEGDSFGKIGIETSETRKNGSKICSHLTMVTF